VALVASRCWESIERARLTSALLASEERLAFSVEASELGRASPENALFPRRHTLQDKAFLAFRK
jgi:hypothetical protein